MLPAEVAPLQQLVIELRQENSYLSSRAAALEEQLRLLRNKIFGRRSEQLSAEELKLAGLFDEAELPPPRAQQPEASVEVAAHRRAKPGRKPLPADLPREEVIHDIPEEEKICSCCGAPLVRISEETSEQLEIVPARMKAIRHIRPKYACKKCEAAESMKIAPAPAQIIEKSIVTPGLLAFILVAKFCDAIPFYRQEKQFARIGVELSRADFCHWAMEAAGKCDALIEIFIE